MSSGNGRAANRAPRFSALFAGGKPLIAMVHVPPLPGTPLYDRAGGMEFLLSSVSRDLEILAGAPFAAFLFCNEGDLPYSFNVGYEAVAAMTRVVTELAPRDRLFGVDLLWDPRAALAVAVASGAGFIREVVTGTYESDMGLWSPDAGALLRERARLGAADVAVLMNITPEFASRLGTREIAQVARSVVVSSLPDAILVSGPMAGAEPDLDTVKRVKDAVAGDVPVLVNTGAKAGNIRQFLEVADGAIVGSDLKRDGYTWNPVDADRVNRFVAAALG